MIKHSMFLIFLTSIIIAHVNGVTVDDAGDDEDQQMTDPALTCAVFDNNSACNTMCSLMGKIYGTPVAAGICDEDKICECAIFDDATLDDLWNSKFDSDSVLQEIRHTISEEILNILRVPFRTREQTKQDLRPFLSEEQFNQLHVKDTISEKLLSSGDNPDKDAIKSYTAKNLKSSATPLRSPNYKKILDKSLDIVDDETFDYLNGKIRKSQNKLLNKVLDEHLKKHDIEDTPLENEPETLKDILDIAIVNNIVKPTAPRKKPSRSKEPKVPGNNPRKGKSAETSTPGTTSTSSSNKISPKKQPYKLIDLTQFDGWFDEDSNVNDETRWDLPGFDKTEIRNLKSGKRCWNKNDYNVCLTKTPTEKSLWWSRKDVLVQMKKSSTGDMTGDWLFRNINVRLSRKADGELRQTWTFANSRLDYVRNADGKVTQTWDGPKDQKSIDKFKPFIVSWCKKNDFFLGKDNCVMF